MQWVWQNLKQKGSKSEAKVKHTRASVSWSNGFNESETWTKHEWSKSRTRGIAWSRLWTKVERFIASCRLMLPLSSPFNRIMRSKPVPKHSNEQNLRRVGSWVQWRFVQLHWTFWFVNVFLNKNVEAHSKLMISFIIEVGRRNQIKQLHCLYFIFLYILVFVFVPDLYFVFCLSIFVFLNLKVAH